MLFKIYIFIRVWGETFIVFYAPLLFFSWPHRYKDENEEHHGFAPHPSTISTSLHALNIHYSVLSAWLIIKYQGRYVNCKKIQCKYAYQFYS